MALLDDAPLIEARLREICLTAGDNVFQTESLAGVNERSQTTPALHLVMHSYRPLRNVDGATSNWRTVWLVIVVVKHARQGVGARSVAEVSPASQLIKEVVSALDGWRCPGALGRMRAIDPPAPLITAGFGYFPLAFEVEGVLEGAPVIDY